MRTNLMLRGLEIHLLLEDGVDVILVGLKDCEGRDVVGSHNIPDVPALVLMGEVIDHVDVLHLGVEELLSDLPNPWDGPRSAWLSNNCRLHSI